MLTRVVKEAAATLRDVIFPPVCAACDAPLSLPATGYLCPECMNAVKPIESPYCSTCGIPFAGPDGSSHACGACIKNPPSFTKARSPFLYKGPIRELLHRIKYKEDGYALKAIQYLSSDFMHAHPDVFDAAIPVPLHRIRMQERGFNQSIRIAMKFFSRKKVLFDLLERTRNTPSQTGLGSSERIKNVKGAFHVSKKLPQGLNSFLVVDDVLTTGATAIECAKALRKAGAKEVQVFTVARAV